MIIHCSRKLAAKLPHVSKEPLAETSVLGSWHSHVFVLDRRQCVLFCHDLTRFMLFMPGWRKEEFAALDYWFRDLFANTMLKLNYPPAIFDKGMALLTAPQFDTATERSVQASMRMVILEIEAHAADVPNVMDLPMYSLSARMNHRPQFLKGMKASEALWPDKAMREFIESATPGSHLRLVQ
jgi:hypothetical protein